MKPKKKPSVSPSSADGRINVTVRLTREQLASLDSVVQETNAAGGLARASRQSVLQHFVELGISGRTRHPDEAEPQQ
jgi:hypothetical protein